MAIKDDGPRESVADSVRTGAELARAAQLDRDLAEQLIERARREGVNLAGAGGLLSGLVKLVLEGALEAELTEHLGCVKGDKAGAGSVNSRNGTSKKRVLTEVGSVDVEVPRDRAGSFVPQVVPKHSRRIEGFDQSILSLYAKGLTTGETQARLAEIYDVEVSRDPISRATDKVAGELDAWRNRPLDRTYAVVMIDAIVIKIRDGAAANRSVCVAIGINLQGERDVLGMRVGSGGEGAKAWMTWRAELKNSGVQDVLIACTTNMIESLNSRFRQATRRRGHFPDERSALKVPYLVIRDRQPNSPHITGRTRNWKEAINTLAGYYGDRITDY